MQGEGEGEAPQTYNDHVTSDQYPHRQSIMLCDEEWSGAFWRNGYSVHVHTQAHGNSSAWRAAAASGERRKSMQGRII